MTRRMHWVAHQGVRQRFERMETRLDDQFDDVNNNIRGIKQQMVTIQEAITNLGNRRGHHSSSSSSSRTHRSSRHDSSSNSNSRRGEPHRHNRNYQERHHHQYARSPMRHERDASPPRHQQDRRHRHEDNGQPFIQKLVKLLLNVPTTMKSTQDIQMTTGNTDLQIFMHEESNMVNQVGMQVIVRKNKGANQGMLNHIINTGNK